MSFSKDSDIWQVVFIVVFIVGIVVIARIFNSDNRMQKLLRDKHINELRSYAGWIAFISTFGSIFIADSMPPRIQHLGWAVAILSAIICVLDFLIQHILDKTLTPLKNRFDDTLTPLAENLANKIKPLEDYMNEYKKDHLRHFNLKNLECFKSNNPIFSNSIVKRTGMLYINSLTHDYYNAIEGQMKIRDMDHMLQMLGIIADEANGKKYEIRIIEDIDTKHLPHKLSDGHHIINAYQEVIADLASKAQSPLHRISIFPGKDDLSNEDLLLMLFRQRHPCIQRRLLFSDRYFPDKEKREYTSFAGQLMITIKPSECVCSTSDSDCSYCYAIQYHSPFDARYLKSQSGSGFLYVKHKDTLHNGEHPFERVYKLLAFDLKEKASIAYNQEAPFAYLENDPRDFYMLFYNVFQQWEKVHESENPKNIFACDTTILDNDIDDWLNRPFYEYVLSESRKVAEHISRVTNNRSSFTRVFVIDKIRKSKIDALFKVIDAHGDKFNILLAPVSALFENNLSCIRDCTLFEEGPAYEIIGLRRSIIPPKRDAHDNDVPARAKLIVGDLPPVHLAWSLYNFESDEHKQLVTFFENLMNCTIAAPDTVMKLHRLLEEKGLIWNEAPIEDQRRCAADAACDMIA